MWFIKFLVGVVLIAIYLIGLFVMIGLSIRYSRNEKRNEEIEKYNRELAKRYGEDPDLFT